MTTLSSTTIRTALVDHRAELLRLARIYPTYLGPTYSAIIEEIDAVLLTIEGNHDRVSVQPSSCYMNF